MEENTSLKLSGFSICEPEVGVWLCFLWVETACVDLEKLHSPRILAEEWIGKPPMSILYLEDFGKGPFNSKMPWWCTIAIINVQQFLLADLECFIELQKHRNK